MSLITILENKDCMNSNESLGDVESDELTLKLSSNHLRRFQKAK